nr:ParB N-terminal domain-containing protein [Hyphomicrobiales bacterium]
MAAAPADLSRGAPPIGDVGSRPIDSLKMEARGEAATPEERIHKLSLGIRARGFITPILVDRLGVVLAGQGRVEAAKAMGLSEVPCVAVEAMSEDDRHAFHLD